MPVDKNKALEEQAFLEGNDDVYNQIKELEQKVDWLEKGLKELANGRDDMNPAFIKNIAQAILDGDPTTADEENVVYISDVNKEIAIDWKNRDREEKIKKECPIPVKGSRDGYWEPEIPKEQTWIGPGDPGDENNDVSG